MNPGFKGKTPDATFDWRVLLMQRGPIICLVTHRGNYTTASAMHYWGQSIPSVDTFTTREQAGQNFDALVKNWVRNGGWLVIHLGTPLLG